MNLKSLISICSLEPPVCCQWVRRPFWHFSFKFQILFTQTPTIVFGHNKKDANRTMKLKRPLLEQNNMFGSRIKIMWEEQPVDHSIHYFICVIVPYCYQKFDDEKKR